jgi:hypothetical protein
MTPQRLLALAQGGRYRRVTKKAIDVTISLRKRRLKLGRRLTKLLEKSARGFRSKE